ncbi:Holliday junction resolvase [archaeon]|nr:Holliday junction resolvase [archaeon]|tara:strand:- start:1514 stop:1897 length:384 start_codon:yes stop_codon:yes gene_type:complete
MKQKGTRAERELLHLFYDHGWICVRAAGSGSIPLPCPDVIAGHKGRVLAIECKSTKKKKKYLEKREVKELIVFAETFGARPVIALRCDRAGWFFFSAYNLYESEKFFVADSAKGILFETIIEIPKES